MKITASRLTTKAARWTFTVLIVEIPARLGCIDVAASRCFNRCFMCVLRRGVGAR